MAPKLIKQTPTRGTMISGKKKAEHRNGNYGAPKVQAKKESLDLTKSILNKVNLRIPGRNEAFIRLANAYNQTTDPRMRATLWEMLRSRKATLQYGNSCPLANPSNEP